MDNAKPQLYLIGAGDSWVAELEDVAALLGYECVRVALAGFLASKDFDLTSTVSDKLVPKGASLFLAFQPHPSVVLSNHAVKVQSSRQAILKLQIAESENWKNLIHPTAWVSPSTQLGRGVFIGANASVGANTEIGNHSTINRNASIGHNVSIAECVEINSNTSISSGVRIHPWVFIGPGVSILNDVVIGEGAIIGAGSVVTREVLPNTTVFGAPAKPR